MAKKLEHEKVVESDSDTSDDSAKQSDSDSDSDSDSEPKLTQTSSTPAAAKKPISKPQQPSFSSSESESDSESDCEPNPKETPIPTKAKDQPWKSPNGANSVKLAAADPVSPTRSAAQKRPADEEGADASSSKKSKKKAEPETDKKATDTPKKSIIQRFWSEDDEIVIVQGMIDYKNEKKADPSANLGALHEFIKKNLSRKDSVTPQLVRKIKTLKRKYKVNKIKEENMENDGKGMTFSKSHDKKLFELSETVWGNKNDVKESDRKGAAAAANKRSTVVAVERVASMGVTMEERVLRIGAVLFENGKGEAGEEEWKKLRLEDMEANLKLLEVKTAQTRLVVERLMSEEGP